MAKTLEELMEKISETYDPDELVDILDINTEDLVQYLSDVIEEKRIKFEEIDDE